MTMPHRLNQLLCTVLVLGASQSLAWSSARSPHLPSSSNLPTTSESTNEDTIRVKGPANMLDRRAMILGSAATFAATSPMSFPAIVHASTPREIPEWTLEGGVKMPVLALNTVALSVEEAERAVALAVQNGITHVDFHPGKERDGVARYLANGGDRSKLFLNTKIRKAPPGTSPGEAAERARQQIKEDLEALNLKSVDMLMLRDSPDAEVIQAQWAILEEALKKGQTRSIGVINFCEFSLKSVLQTATITPALNYYMLHVGMGVDPKGLRTFGESRGIRTFAYGAAGEPGPNPELLNSPVVKQIAKAHKVAPEAVALRWVLQSGAAVSVRPTLEFGLGTGACAPEKCGDGISARAASFSWELTTKEMAKLSALTSPNDNPTLFSSAGCPGAFLMPK